MYAITSDNIITQIENNGHARITFKVDGYWSSEQITVSISKRWSEDWCIQESHSSGGECSKWEGTNSQRTLNFASAMMEAADRMKSIARMTDTLDTALKTYKAKVRKMEEERQAAFEKARQARIEADRKDREENPSMGIDVAVAIADRLKKIVSKSDSGYSSIEVMHRAPGARGHFNANAGASKYRTQTRYEINGQSYSRKNFIELLATEFVLVDETAVAA